MRRLLAFLLGALSLSACGGDEGRLGCDDLTDRLTVRVVDARNQPVEDADVFAVRSAGGIPAVASTNGDGVAQFGAELAPNTVLVHAEEGDRTSGTAQADWVCGECGCSVTPPQVTLTLN